MPDIRGTFHRCGLRCTRQRELVYRALASTTAHPTADELYQRLHTEPQDAGDHDASLSLATIYNTLEAFCSAGLIRKIAAPDGKGPCRYDADLSDHAHAAFPDGRLVDVPPDLSRRIAPPLTPDLAQELANRLGVSPDRLSVQVIVHAEARPPRQQADNQD